MMRYTRLGNSELNVSRICMGCMGVGDAKSGQHTGTIDEEHTREIIQKGLESGINFYDTAIGYQNGTSEQYLRKALRDYAKRDEVVVATKFLPRTPEEIGQGVPAQEHMERIEPPDKNCPSTLDTRKINEVSCDWRRWIWNCVY